ncbi:hypothetical protein Scep_030505 [Stephania cephalantha]|uniref:Uncharacterized protein n=1 Tax=Stephania cephalantha TaxID=152367 RepID=A0AAP0DZR6_9MAGN
MDGPPEMSTFDSARTTRRHGQPPFGKDFQSPPHEYISRDRNRHNHDNRTYRTRPEALPKMVALRHPQPATAQPAEADAGPQKRMHGKEYRRKNMKKPKQ